MCETCFFIPSYIRLETVTINVKLNAFCTVFFVSEIFALKTLQLGKARIDLGS